MDQDKKDLATQTDAEMQTPPVKEDKPVGKKERTAEQESQRMMKIKAGVTVAAIALIALLAIKFWDSDGGYQFRISTDEGYTWECAIRDESMVKKTSEELKDGKYICKLEGLSAGKVEVDLKRIKIDQPDYVAEERTYHLTVTDDLFIIQNSVDRQVYEE